MEYKKMILPVLAFFFLLAGCNFLNEEKVTDKWFEEAHYEIENGVSRVYVEDSWYIVIESDVEYYGMKRKEKYSVTKEEYERVNIGDYVKINRGENTDNPCSSAGKSAKKEEERKSEEKTKVEKNKLEKNSRNYKYDY